MSLRQVDDRLLTERDFGPWLRRDRRPERTHDELLPDVLVRKDLFMTDPKLLRVDGLPRFGPSRIARMELPFPGLPCGF